MEGCLAGKRTCVTGAGSGIGRAIAERFAAEGGSVACADLDRVAAGVTAKRIAAAGGVACAIEVDVASPESCEALATAVAAEFGGADVIVANAGINIVGDALETSVLEWKTVIDVNLSGVWYTNRAFLPLLLDAGGGAIVNQASVVAVAAMQRVAAYAAAKGGVVALTRAIARDFGSRNIRANAILPGTVRTPMVERTYAARGPDGLASVDEALIQAASRYPRGRLGEPEDIAAMAAFLAGDDADWITGAAYAVDGGLTAVVGW